MLPFGVFIAHVHSTWPTLQGQLMLTAYVSFLSGIAACYTNVFCGSHVKSMGFPTLQHHHTKASFCFCPKTRFIQQALSHIRLTDPYTRTCFVYTRAPHSIGNAAHYKKKSPISSWFSPLFLDHIHTHTF